MLINYLKIAFRSIRRQRFYSAINILGLAIGLAISLLILLFIKDEVSYDKHHTNADRIHRAIMVWGKHTDNPSKNTIGPYRLKPALETDFPELEKVVRIDPVSNVLITYGEQAFQENKCFITDPEIFDIFDFDFLQGDPKTALTEPFTIVLSETLAKKYFAKENPMGKVLTVFGQMEIKVTGVYKDTPTNTHFTAEGLVSMGTGESFYNQMILNNWGEGLGYTYLLLPKNMEAATLAAKLPDFVKKNLGEDRAKQVGIELQKMTDIHLRSNYRSEIQANSDIRYVYISAAIALFILLIASINYMNLATARSVKRALEIGVRKTLGAERSTLIWQFLSESVLVAFIALILAFGIAALSITPFNTFVEKSLSINPLNNPSIFAYFLGITLLVGLIAGSYPALYLSSFAPIQVFRAHFGNNSGRLRRSLVVFQFAISILLIFSTVVVYQQWNFMRHKDLGLNKENLLILPIPDQAQYQSYKNQLLNNPNILSIGASNKQLTGSLSSNLGFKAEAYTPDPNVRNSVKVVTNDHDFLKTLEVEFKAGRNFSRDFVSDDSTAFILNEAAVKLIGWNDDPIGKWFETSEFKDGGFVPRRGKIIGVIKDYNHESLYNEVTPAVYFISKNWISWMTVRVADKNLAATMADIKEKWIQFESPELYSYSFLDDRIDQMYRTEERFFNIFTFFAILAVFIAGLGILGLSAFMAERRQKEIGIRKVYGASTQNLVYLLTKEFSILVLIGFIIAAPLGYYFLDDWLQGFTYRTTIGWPPFALAGLLALLMAWTTSGFQSLKAALANPIRALRNE